MTQNRVTTTDETTSPRPGIRGGAKWLAGAVGTATILTVGLLSAGTAHADATGCTGRNGPGDFNGTCISVHGTGTHVDHIRGSLGAVKYPAPTPRPAQVCQVDVTAYGTLADGRRYSAHGSAKCNYAGVSYVDFYPNEDFKADSQVCVRTTYLGRTGDPACETIR